MKTPRPGPRRLRLSLLLPLLAGLAGCAVDQDAEVAIYRSVLDADPDAAARARETADAIAAGAPVSLREAMLLANAQNESLAAQGERYLREVINRKRAVAAFLPTLDLVPAWSIREKAGGGGSGGDGLEPDTGVEDETADDRGGSEDLSRVDVTAELSWTLFDGFRRVNAYLRDTQQIEAARGDLLALQETLLLDVARAYFQVLQSEQAVQVLEASLTTQAERLREARGRVAAGLASPLAEAQIAAQRSATRSQLLAAQREVTQLRAALTQLVGTPLYDAALLESPADVLPDALPPLPALLEAAEANRADLAAALAATQAARSQVEVAVGQYYPSVAVDFTTFLYRESEPTERDWEAFFQANIPIFAAGRIRADVREAWSFFRESVLLSQLLRRSIAVEVRQAYAAASISDERLEEARTQLAAAEQALRQAEESYRAGIATNLERVAAQEALLEAQLLLTSEAFNRQIFRLELLRATGRLREWLEGQPPDPI